MALVKVLEYASMFNLLFNHGVLYLKMYCCSTAVKVDTQEEIVNKVGERQTINPTNSCCKCLTVDVSGLSLLLVSHVPSYYKLNVNLHFYIAICKDRCIYGNCSKPDECL